MGGREDRMNTGTGQKKEENEWKCYKCLIWIQTETFWLESKWRFNTHNLNHDHFSALRDCRKWYRSLTHGESQHKQPNDQFEHNNDGSSVSRNDARAPYWFWFNVSAFYTGVWISATLRSSLLEARFVHNGASQISSIRSSPRVPVIIPTSPRICS
jgi:hypothetical protein